MRKFSKRMSCVWEVRGTIYGFGCVSKSVFSYDDDDDDTVTMSERLHGSASQGVMVSERLDNSASPVSRDRVGSDQSQFGGGGAIGGNPTTRVGCHRRHHTSQHACKNYKSESLRAREGSSESESLGGR